MRKQEIRAIYEEDLDSFLEKIELLEPLNKGELLCAVCNEKITRENFKFVFVESDDIKICCNKTGCYEKVISKIK
jgi:hypothetical protein